MKTQKEIAEIAEEYSTKEFGIYQLRKLPNLNETVREVIVKAFIKGYQAAQEEMKQCPTCKSLSDTWDNEKDEQFNNL